jgi:hypothetical protein
MPLGFVVAVRHRRAQVAAAMCAKSSRPGCRETFHELFRREAERTHL